MTPLWGRLAAIIGRRQAILASMALFISGTIGCALAPTMGVILVARFVAGCAGGGMLTVTAIIVRGNDRRDPSSRLVDLELPGVRPGFAARTRPLSRWDSRVRRAHIPLTDVVPTLQATSTSFSRSEQPQERSLAAS